MSTRMAVLLLLGMAAIIAGTDIWLWHEHATAQAIAYAATFGTIWLVVAGLCVWAARL